MAKSHEKATARLMRIEGKSIKEIAKELRVSPGTVSIWCTDIVLTSDQSAALAKRMIDPQYGQRAIYLQKIKEETKKKIHRLRLEGMAEIGRLTHRELFIAGIALYWAEGFKKDKQIGFANLDPHMINFFIRWLTECLHIRKRNIKLRIVINDAYVDKTEDLQAYWSQITAVPLSNFQKPTIQKVTWKKEYENKDDYKGILRIRVAKSLPQLRKIFGYIDCLHSSIRD